MSKTPSPCIDVCKFRRPGPAGSHCIGCSMTKEQKKISKRVKGKAREAFVALVVSQQKVMGRYDHWRGAYLKRCLKKGARAPEIVRKAG
ncbi:DUF1289 domain-containing protein [Jannaschia aquimarina]|uniref:DUF1289 domain-containing protein n=1 Tax=Jannaschia aquimarina TaxID=935700 RepID=A0A0D1EKS7_9RHOB|nr:DUF1289 domain-containing protein [Jannaschia aquimarina]KIT16330.1 hypothetical protein jaqu_19260 [Jannaschia aquimarina]SNT26073.1 hypothetical protein SAMN05421775_10959 [Jannaschia aquimarina]